LEEEDWGGQGLKMGQDTTEVERKEERNNIKMRRRRKMRMRKEREYRGSKGVTCDYASLFLMFTY
jgi:hypothetical protein